MENHTDPVTNLARGSNDGHLFLYTYMYAYVCVYILYMRYAKNIVGGWRTKRRALLVRVRSEYPLFGIPRSISLSFSPSLFALDNSVSSSKLPSIVVVLLVRGSIERIVCHRTWSNRPFDNWRPVMRRRITCVRLFGQIFAVKRKWAREWRRYFEEK